MKILVRSHNDVDGIVSFYLLRKLLREEFPGAKIVWHPGKTLREEEVKKIAMTNHDLIVLLDTGSERGEAINKYLKNKRVWIIDHHRRFDRPMPDVEFYRNPTEEGKDTLEYAVTATLVFEELRKRKIATRFDAFLAATAAAADIADFRGKWQGLNWKAIKFAAKGKNIDMQKYNIIRYKWVTDLYNAIKATYYPVPTLALEVFKNELDVNWYEGDQKELSEYIELVYADDPYLGMRTTLFNRRFKFTGIQEIHEFAAFLSLAENPINAIKNPEGPIDDVRKKAEIMVKNSTKSLPDVPIIDLGTVNLAVTPEWVPSYVATLLATRKYTEKPLIVLSKYKGIWYITARQHPKHDMDLGKLVYEATKGIGYGGGHRFAAGGGIYTKPGDFALRLKEVLRSF